MSIPFILFGIHSSLLHANSPLRSPQNDDPTAATCCRFDPTGDYIYAGYLNAIRVFRTDLPGRSCDLRQTVSARKRKDGQKGIVSALAVNPVHNIYAAGSYSGSIYVYDERSDVLVGEVETR